MEYFEILDNKAFEKIANRSTISECDRYLFRCLSCKKNGFAVSIDNLKKIIKTEGFQSGTCIYCQKTELKDKKYNNLTLFEYYTVTRIGVKNIILNYCNNFKILL